MYASFGGGLPVLMAGDLNAKHVDWNSRLSARRGKLLRDYADGNSCLIFGPDFPSTNPYNTSATPDVLECRDNQRSPIRGASDFLLCTKLRSSPLTHRQYVSLILPTPTGST